PRSAAFSLASRRLGSWAASSSSTPTRYDACQYIPPGTPVTKAAMSNSHATSLLTPRSLPAAACFGEAALAAPSSFAGASLVDGGAVCAAGDFTSNSTASTGGFSDFCPGAATVLPQAGHFVGKGGVSKAKNRRPHSQVTRMAMSRSSENEGRSEERRVGKEGRGRG